jgi:pyridoxal phosphate enzyme (YggS family)
VIADRGQVLRNLEDVRRGIAAAAERAGRDPVSVTLVAVTKTVPVDPVRWVVEAGVDALGENYVQELREKRGEVPGAIWHFIGTLQSHTARHVADHADVVQTLAGERAARRLAGRAARSGRRLDSLIEVDLAGGRTGVGPEALSSFADLVAALDGIRLVGLMTMPPMPKRPGDTRPFFARLRGLRDEVHERHPDVLELSMGMSLDYEVAVEEGATMVRVGTALFGPRAPGVTEPSEEG